MALQGLLGVVSRFGLQSALLVSVTALPACGGEMGEFDDFEDVAEVEQAVGWGGTNNLPPQAVASDPLKRGVTNSHGITSPSNPDPLPLCAGNTITSTGCTLKQEWKAWLNADEYNRVPMMKAIAKCSVESSFTIVDSSGTFAFPGQWPLYPSWKSNRLNGQDKRERVSSCILSLLNGNDANLSICIIGPGGAPFSDACSDPNMTLREGGFFGDLFAPTPTAYVAGPDSADPVDSGRACFGSQGNYCCSEADTACPQRIVLTGAILGSPDQNFANKRCNAQLVNSGGNLYCPSFYSTREPGRSYTNVFTTFVPSVP
ncbi:MAG: hypothetical protein IPM54_44180 [Polyangiaceae bacterium]|nr:hypothetical protein [Polyangiaceae bacterium]